MTLSSHPMFRTQEEYQAHIAAQIELERSRPPRPVNKTLTVEWEWQEDGGYLPVKLIRWDEPDSMSRVWTDEEIRAETALPIVKETVFFPNAWKRHKKALARAKERDKVFKRRMKEIDKALQAKTQ